MYKHLIFLFCFFPILGYSAEELSVNAWKGFRNHDGVPISPGDELVVQDQYWLSLLNGYDELFCMEGSMIEASLRWDDADLYKSLDSNSDRQDWEVVLVCDLLLFSHLDPSNPTKVEDKVFTINYSHEGIYTDYDFEVYEGYERAELHVVSFLATGDFPTLDDRPLDVFVELKQLSKRHYKQPQSSNQEVVVVNEAAFIDWNVSTESELNLQWNASFGAESYQLEWMHIGMADAELQPDGSVLSDGILDQGFSHLPNWRDAARVALTGNDYQIPLLYRKGVILYRVRSVYVDCDNGREIYGDWSGNDQIATLNAQTLSSFDHVVYAGFSEEYNWLAESSFAENGLRVDQVTYVDGIGQARQSLSSANDVDFTVLQPLFYDAMGRPSIQVMSSPIVPEDELNKLALQTSVFSDFDKHKFDIDLTPGDGVDDVTNRVQQPAPLTIADGGSALYYSPSNPFIEDYNHGEYIPDAEGYVFGRTVYKNDGTNRTISQSSVGAVFAKGGVHETEMVYGSVMSQFELDRLFGNEAGLVNNYQKVYTVDPNGQVSASYLDQEGRTIATCLVGNDTAGKLLDLDLRPSAEVFVSDLLENNTFIGSSIQSEKIIVVPPGGPKTFYFRYQLSEDMVSSECADYDATCEHNISIQIHDDMGYLVFDIYEGYADASLSSLEDPSLPGIFGYVDGVDAPFSLTEVMDNGGEVSFEVQLAPGTYTLTKNLILDSQEKENHLSSLSGIFELPFSTELSLNDLEQEVTSFQLGPCMNFEYISPECDCVPEENGDDFCIPEFDMISEGNLCEGIRSEMLQDMSPGGQYFDNLPDLNNPFGYEPNAFMDELVYLIADCYQHATFFDLLNAEFNQEVAFQGWTSLQDIRDGWDGSWPEVMEDFILLHHPEYCRYWDECEGLRELYAWDFQNDCWSGDPYNCFQAPHGPAIYDYDEFGEWEFLQEFNAITTHQDAVNVGLYECHYYWNGEEANPFSIPSDQYTSLQSMISWDLIFPTFQDYLNSPSYHEGSTYSNSNTLYSSTDIYDPLCSMYLDRTMTGQDEPFANGVLTIGQQLHDRFEHHIQVGLPGYEYVNLFFLMEDPLNIAQNGTGLVGYEILDDLFAEFHQIYNTADLRLTYFKQVYLQERSDIIASLKDENYYETNFMDWSFDYYNQGFIPNQGFILARCNCYLYGSNGDITSSDHVTDFASGQWVMHFGNPFGQNGGLIEGVEGLDNDGLQDIADEGCTNFCTENLNNLLSQIEPRLYNDLSPAEWGTYLGVIQDTDPGSFQEDFETLCSNSCAEGFALDDCDINPNDVHGHNSNFVELLEHHLSLAGLNISTPCNQLNVVENPVSPSEYHCTVSKIVNMVNSLSGEIALEEGLTLDTAYPQYDIWNHSAAIADYFAANFSDVLNTADGEVSPSASLLQNIYTVYLDSYYTNCGDQSCLEGEFAPLGGGTPFIDPMDIPLFYSCIIPESTDPDDMACEEQLDIALSNWIFLYETAAEQAIDNFEFAYCEDCMDIDRVNARESFFMEYELNEYYYTLYYYDQAHNLIKTVPPEDVRKNKLTTTVDFTNIQGSAEEFFYGPSGIISTAHFNNGDPGGIDLMDVANHRLYGEGEFVHPPYKMVTNYIYNSFDQIRRSFSPDGGYTYFFYDRLGRIVASQNEEQMEREAYSYTFYDALARITESGEAIIPGVEITEELTGGMESWDAFELWLNTNYTSKRDVVRSYYNETPFANVVSHVGYPITNGRKRIASVVRYDEITAVTQEDEYHSASHFYYDAHGNVALLVQENKELEEMGESLKTIEYDYDLISGNVKEVRYQEGDWDQFYHRYLYDAQNRLKVVETSSDQYHWEQDAKYIYYEHGPLARVEYGSRSVQGVDYAYTLQGWLKGVNAVSMRTNRDLGKDGRVYDAGVEVTDNPDAHFSEDMYGYSLTYYGNEETDYKSIGGFTLDEQFTAEECGVCDEPTGYVDLFNGNISRMITSFGRVEPMNYPQEGALGSNLSTYRYDQLNRIKSMNASILSWQDLNGNQLIDQGDPGSEPPVTFQSEYSFDFNGNIMSLKRWDGQSTLFDNISYVYNDGGGGNMKNNQLLTAFDAAGDVAEINDFEGHGLDNYGYNPLGELIKDSKEQIENIIWTADHKISYIKRGQVDLGQDTEASSDLKFSYDAMGNRISKHVIPRDANLELESEENQTQEFYVRDASGNPLAVYKKSYNPSALGSSGPLIGTPPVGHDQVAVLALQENSIYGSQRVGLHRDYRAKVYSFSTTIVTDPYTGAEFFSGEDYFNGLVEYQIENRVTRTNKKSYEFSNHLGNVLSTSSDRKKVLESNEELSEYISQVLSQQDYYPFGMQMPGRQFSQEEYRYGFQSQEEDDELWGGAVSYKYRVEDPRLGRFFSVDPLAPNYPWNSPYAFSENKVIHMIELEGLEAITFQDGSVVETGPVSPEKSMEVVIDHQQGESTIATLGDGSWGVLLPEVEISAEPSLGVDPVPLDDEETDIALRNIQQSFDLSSAFFSISGEFAIQRRNQQVNQFLSKFNVTTFRGSSAHVDNSGKIYRGLNRYAQINIPSKLTRYSTKFGKLGAVGLGASQTMDIYQISSSSDPIVQAYHMNLLIMKTPGYVPGLFGVIYGSTITPVYDAGTKGVSDIVQDGGSITPFLITPGGGYPLRQ